MASLSEYTNVYNTALLILRRKGYQLWYDPNTQDYCAEQRGWDFRSPSPCGLLGLIAIFESKHPSKFVEYWWREDGPEIYEKLPHQAEREYQPIGSRRTRDT
jgi:hypothetical protein